MSFRNNLDTLLKSFEKEFATHNLIEISGSSILHNIDTFSRLSGTELVIPVLKANAYGHGIKQTATALTKRKLPYIAVDGYFEALRIRDVSDQPVLVMGTILPENFIRMKYDKFTFVVQDASTIDALAKTGQHIKIHLECNTGMNRYGAKAEELTSLTKLILRHKNLQLEGVMSHLADSDGDDPSTVDAAVTCFDTCVEMIRKVGGNPTIIHIAQSAGSLKAKSKYANAIRLGIGLYGINPFPVGSKQHKLLDVELQPALRLLSTITKAVTLQKGEQVSYNYTFTAPKRMRIGVLPLGYYEGLNRALSNRGVVKIGSAITPIVGRVCMNHSMISLDGIEANVGDSVIVYSNDPKDANAVDNVAIEHKLFNYNLLTALSSDVRRTLVK